MKKLLQKIIDFFKKFFGENKKPKEVFKLKPPLVETKPEHKPKKPKVSSNPNDPLTDFGNANIFALLWKPKKDHGNQSVIVAWSDNISYKDLHCQVISTNGKILADTVVEPWYERKHNVHGKYGGINFIPGRSANEWPKNPIFLKFYITVDGKQKFVKVDGHESIIINNPRLSSDKGRVEVKYKSNNYRG